MRESESNNRVKNVRRGDSLVSHPRSFLAGAAAPWNGLRFMSDNPGLWRYGLLPIAVNLLITGLLLGLLIGGGFYFLPAMHDYFAGGWWWRIVEVFAVLATIIAAVGLLLAVWLVLQAVLCGWFYDLLARQVELRLGTSPDELKDAPIAVQAIDALRAVGFIVVVNMGCLIVQIVPVVGSALGLCGSYYFTCATLGYEFFDYPLALRGLRRRDKLAFVRRHRPSTLGLGTSVALLAFVPVVSAVFLTTAVVGGVLLHKRLQ
ncbi:MAG: EI24 domain-containing protein [Pirellulales bacterium]|nr:EI24 domain-containing protein [Pirellulales bacterium]